MAFFDLVEGLPFGFADAPVPLFDLDLAFEALIIKHNHQ